MEENKTNVTPEGAAVEAETTEGQKTYTQEEVDALLQAETDRRVTSALKKQAEKNAEESKADTSNIVSDKADDWQMEL